MLPVIMSCKKNDIKPVSLPMYSQEYTIGAYTYKSTGVDCFIVLNGGTISSYYVISSGRSYQYAGSISPEKVDLGLASGALLTAPGSPDAADVFNSTIGDNTRVGDWDVRNNGLLAITNLSKSSFDTLQHIEAVKPLARAANQSSVVLKAGQVIAFNLTRAYGIMYVNSASSDSADVSMKYLLIKQ